MVAAELEANPMKMRCALSFRAPLRVTENAGLNSSPWACDTSDPEKARVGIWPDCEGRGPSDARLFRAEVSLSGNDRDL